MSSFEQRVDLASPKRRYLVHLCCAHEEGNSAFRYIARIQLWASRVNVCAKTQERTFTDEDELIATLNPLLPHGSDVRNVLSHIESPDGFLYLLRLTSEEAKHLGWLGS